MGLIDQMMANLYKPAKQEKNSPALPKHLTPAKLASMTSQTSVFQGQLLRGEVLDLRANQIMVLLENGATVTARTEGTLNLSIGQNAQFLVAQTTEEQILLKLAMEDTPIDNPMIDKALSAAHITKTERSSSIVTELLAHQQPVNEAGIRHYLSLSAKYPELPVKDLILMDLHHIPVSKENVAQFVDYHKQNGKLLTQTQHMLQELADGIAKLPDDALKQELTRELETILLPSKEPTLSFAKPVSDNIGPEPSSSDAIMQPSVPDAVMQPSDGSGMAEPVLTSDTTAVPATHDAISGHSAENLSEHIPERLSERSSEPGITEDFIRDFIHSFLLKPEDIAEPDNVQKYYEELNEKLTKLEQFSLKLAGHTKESDTDVPKQLRSNLSFLESVNQVFPYIQLPLRFRETPTHGELYVYEKKRSLKPSDTLSALLHLEMEALGTTDIYVTLTGTHVTTHFSMENKESGDLILSELPMLAEALAKKGFSLQSEVSVHKATDKETTPTLLEQFLENHAPSGMNRYTFDIRA